MTFGLLLLAINLYFNINSKRYVRGYLYTGPMFFFTLYILTTYTSYISYKIILLKKVYLDYKVYRYSINLKT